jgi:endo-1,4-beta-xylanase
VLREPGAVVVRSTSGWRRGRGHSQLVALLSVFFLAGTALLAIPDAAADTSSWTNIATSGPPADAQAAMTYDQANSTDVLFTTSGQTWTWTGATWTQQAPAAPTPPPRAFASMAYDSAHGYVVLFGGCTTGACSSFLGDTWTWDGTKWTQQNPTLSPPARGGAGLAWDNVAARPMLFGGYAGFGVFYGDTWAWSGTTWNELVANFVTTAAGPSPRGYVQMSEDAANNSVVLFGGGNVSGAMNDTWVWNDSSVPAATTGQWTLQRPQHSPPARGQGAMAYSPAAGVPVLFGGQASSTAGSDGDTWTWTGADWVAQTPTGIPAARSGPAMATSPSGDVVLVGGASSGGKLSDTWSWTGTANPYPGTTPEIFSCPTTTEPVPTTSGTGTLRGAAAVSHPGLLIGAALPGEQGVAANALEQQTDGSQFNLIASNNQMYWSAAEPEPGVFNFCDGDRFVGLAQAYHQTLRLHNLLAGSLPSQNPNWINTPSVPWTSATLTAALKEWITTAVTHYAGSVGIFDVANEAIDSLGNPVRNVFEKVIGYPKYVEEAFQFAHAADPSATLLYDDYSDWFGAKKTAVYNLVQDLVNKGVGINAVGFELFGVGAWELNTDLAGTMSEFAALGLKTAVTQITVPFTGATATDSQETTQANVYGNAMSACLTPASNCFMFMTWGDNDGGPADGAAVYAFAHPDKVTTIPNEPWGGQLFDAIYRPYPAFDTLLGLLQ